MALALGIAALVLAVVAAFRIGYHIAITATYLGIAASWAIIYVSRPYDLPWAAMMKPTAACIVVGSAALIAIGEGWMQAIVLLAGSALVIRLVQAAYYQRYGAITRTAPPLTWLIVEAFTLSYLQKALSPLGQ